VTDPSVIEAAGRAGAFRLLVWPGDDPPVLFLHGLTGVAEVWGPTVAALGDSCPRAFAMDQRGHGHSPQPAAGYEIGRFVDDVVDMAAALGLPPFHLVGHSMGARVAMAFAARHGSRLRSVAIVDIGPEAWRANWEDTVAAFDRMPASFATLDEAVGGAARTRGRDSADAALDTAHLASIARARWRQRADGDWEWLASREALKQAVRSHRSRNFWAEWRAIDVPALLVRGGTSNELRQAIADRMRRENPRVRFVQFDGVGHNVPLIAPTMLAQALLAFWRSV
jgi:pimeloyl-ACP methyl ester carboxylesterase